MIEVHGLTKRYGPVEAVKDVSFSVGKDQVLGFLGPNGAGKTTIMKILTGYHFPSGGKALVDGISVEDDPVEVKKRIGYLPESVPLYGDLTPTEYLDFIAQARLIPKEERKQRLENTLDACGLQHVRSKRIEELSKGYKQRVGLAQAIIHDPPILILDEPTSGLDPNQIIEIRSLIKTLGKSKTVILSTHILQEVEAVCSQVLIINEGRIAAQGSPEEIAGTMKGGDTWELTLKGAEIGSLPEKFSLLDREAKPALESREDGTVDISFFLQSSAIPKEEAGPENPASSGGDEGERIFDWAVSQGFKILRMNRKRLSLEDIFVKLTNEVSNTAHNSKTDSTGVKS
ncbi:ABC-type multidrug transport system, ATPase component [Treponema primitia ZAS-2]|uniref:ABC-type multidrug transport system, ATPase component n=1 Tax=Treponema primitia (strain ATCC BAA-887 / DSM 12427 / ZAS-2) TaxID=545694 RepID=F5YH01_TREPZ|nr:ATP-binding cassette domain-containing protein [Treponema primitia]AEF83851.1 ABC-type multidrug transport system, ATPase component [Treponema primitia ZAS-2]